MSLERGYSADPVHPGVSDKPLAEDFSWLIEVVFKPGVTDNVGLLQKASEDILKTTRKGVYFSRQYLINGKLRKKMLKDRVVVSSQHPHRTLANH